MAEFTQAEITLLEQCFNARLDYLERIAKKQKWLPSELACAKADVIILARTKFHMDI